MRLPPLGAPSHPSARPAGGRWAWILAARRGRAVTSRHKVIGTIALASVTAVVITLVALVDGHTVPAKTSYALTDGCVLNARGVGTCGAPMVGAAVGGNSDPASMEAQWGSRLGIHRTYYGPNQVASAVAQAKADAGVGRIPWISFKLPYDWADMASGRGDAWVHALSDQFRLVDGPVWLAFHHEPEGDQASIEQWTKTQERIGPLVRSAAPNVAFTVILTGWNELYGPSQYSLERIWPKTLVDVAGFDVYCYYGTTSPGGKLRLGDPYLQADYFDKLSVWAAAKNMAWGLAETGLTDRAAERYPHWIQETYRQSVATNALAMVYFDSTLNSTESIALTPGIKMKDFATTLAGAPVLAK